MNVDSPALQSDATTRLRVLRAAGEVFAEKGFAKATVRDICARAGANVAAVNYHFRDKSQLYSEALRWLAEMSLAKYPPNMGVEPSDDPRLQLRAFIRSFLLRILDPDRVADFGRLMTREMVEPSSALDELASRTIRPLSELLRNILRAILGPHATEAQLRRAACSVVGQIVFYNHCRPAIERIFPGHVQNSAADIDALAEHIAVFSIAGLDALRECEVRA
ncbi:MAG: CerR family C-terminal domain-containing protein [Tepidisphaeraceae bacterium]